MAFINKILQKTKHKIGDREGIPGMSPSSEKGPVYPHPVDSPTDPVPLPNSPLGSHQQHQQLLHQQQQSYGVAVVPAATHPHILAHQQQQPNVSVPYQQPATLPSQQTYPQHQQVQKHVVPSNAPMVPSSTSVATRAASFSLGSLASARNAQSAPGGVGYPALYPGQQPMHHPIQQQHQQQSSDGLLHHHHHHHHMHSHHHHHNQHSQNSWEQTQVPQPPERSYEDTHVRLDEFEIFRTVGTGSFGRVRLVKHRETGKYYAMKVLKKSHVVRAKQVEHVNSERRILAECGCPFIVHMLGTCQDRVNLYFFMEYVVGGELFTYLRRYHRFPPPVAKFYAAEVLLALEYLHERNIIWRDTKPENILLDGRGHVKLTDMGFAKKVMDRTWTLCGTPDYLAPEVIQAKGYGRSVDWWALGILIFEMIAGYPPFYDEDHYRLYEKILAGRIQWPAQFDPVARDLVSRLLTADLSRRLGNLHRGSADIKEHRWFAEVDWNRLAMREIPAPLIPPQKVDGDTSNFDKYPETAETYGDMTSEDPYADLFVEF
ncbi:cAMP-dependent protein kinase catalytic subunit [Coemansia sp. RSA 2603]|nr:cAMP-dependent protein kinase catalytic subunit [Coemansia sp. RSA 2603]